MFPILEGPLCNGLSRLTNKSASQSLVKILKTMVQRALTAFHKNTHNTPLRHALMKDCDSRGIWIGQTKAHSSRFPRDECTVLHRLQWLPYSRSSSMLWMTQETRKWKHKDGFYQATVSRWFTHTARKVLRAYWLTKPLWFLANSRLFSLYQWYSLIPCFHLDEVTIDNRHLQTSAPGCHRY